MHRHTRADAPTRRPGRATLLALALVLPTLNACSQNTPADARDARERPARALGSKEQRVIRLANGSDAIEGELLVRFKEDSASTQLHAALRAEVVHAYRSVPGLQLVRVPSEHALEDALATYRARPDVLYAEPNYLYRLDATPNDARFDELWGMHNTGQNSGLADADINAPEAWELTTGSDQTVIAVVDTGIDYRHEDLAANTWVNPGEIPDNGIDDDGNGYVDDVHGINAITGAGDPLDDHRHGTHCAGTIAGRGNNAVGVAGVSWNARIIGCKFLSATGSGSTADAVECLDYLHGLKTRATHPVNLTATSNSWGGGSFSQALQDAIAKHAEAGILFVAAAGNNNANNDTTNNYPSNYYLPNILSVAATDRNDSKASFSSYGRRTVHVGAPGVDILSTLLNNGYGLLSGTSMATPHVSGLVALLKSQDPTRDWKALKNLVIAGGQDVPSMNGITLSGKRIRAADVNGVGSLSCADQVVVSRLQPLVSDIQVLSGATVQIAALNIKCAEPNGNLVLNVTPGGGTVTLTDDGQGFDQVAGDGIYSTEWTPPAPGTHVLTFPGNDTLTITALDVYRPALTPTAEWRTITGTPLAVADNTLHAVTAPFPIRLGNHAGFDTAQISSNGYLSFNSLRSSGVNSNLPTANFQTLVAPFWDDLYTAPTAPIVGDVFHEVLGGAPNREWVIEWRDMGHYSRRTTTPYPTVTFQVVFTEGSSDVKFNYLDVDFGNGTDTYDRGGSGTVGIQVNSAHATRFSYNTKSLTSGLTLLYKTNAPPLLELLTPSVPSITEGDSVTLSSSFTDADGAADADWTAEWDFNYDGKTFTVDASQIHSTPGALSTSRAFPQSGHYLVGLRVKDKDGGPSAVRTAVVVVDNVLPVAVAPTAAPTSPKEGEAFTLTASFTDVGATDNPWRAEWDFNYDGVTFTADKIQSYTAQGTLSVQHTYTDDGTYTVALRVVDKDNGVSAVVTVPLVVTDVNPVIASATATSNSGNEARAVEFNVSATSGSPTPAADPIRYYFWDFDGDGIADHVSPDPRVIHYFADNPAGGDSYNVTVWVEDEDSRSARVIPVGVSNVPPTLADLPAERSASEGSLFHLQASATDPAGAMDPLTYTLVGAPAGMSISTTGLIQWSPTFAQSAGGAGRAYSVTVTVTDDDGASSSDTLTIRAVWKDADNDGMADTWESAHGLDPTTDDAAGDADGDGISNLDEFRNANGGPYTPGQVAVDAPVSLAHVRTNDVTLRVKNTTDPDSTGLTYVFELYTDEALTQRVIEVTTGEHASGKTAVVLDDTQRDDGTADDDAANPNNVNLTDDTWYWWRARATDGAHPGAWSEPQKVFYNPVNDRPTAPTLVSPLSGERVGTALPRLVVDNASDPDDTALHYRFEVYDNEALGGQPVAAATVPAHASGSTRWTVSVPLSNHGRYTWRATAIDPQDGATHSLASTFTVDLGNHVPAAPTPRAPANGTVVASTSTTLEVENVTDMDGDAVSYWFELDTSPSFSSPDRQTSPLLAAGSGGTTAWAVSSLKEDAVYYWRARATDGHGSSDWLVASFRVNAVNGNPSAPIPLSPSNGALLTVARPTLTVLNAVDPEGGALTYEFEVRADTPEGSALANVANVPASAGQTSLVLGQELPRNKALYWTARAKDASGGLGEWSAPALFTIEGLEEAPAGEEEGSGCGVTGTGTRGALSSGLLPLLALALCLRRLRRQR